MFETGPCCTNGNNDIHPLTSIIFFSVFVFSLQTSTQTTMTAWTASVPCYVSRVWSCNVWPLSLISHVACKAQRLQGSRLQERRLSSVNSTEIWRLLTLCSVAKALVVTGMAKLSVRELLNLSHMIAGGCVWKVNDPRFEYTEWWMNRNVQYNMNADVLTSRVFCFVFTEKVSKSNNHKDGNMVGINRWVKNNE